MVINLPKISKSKAKELFFKKVLHSTSPSVTFKPKALGCLRVVTFNAHFGRNIDRVAKAFAANPNLAAADIILLQEIEDRPYEKHGRAQQLARALNFACVYTPVRKLDLHPGTHGLAILSKLPLESTKTIKLPVYPLLRMRPRLATVSELKVDGKKIKIYNVHLNGPLNHGKRLLQLQEVIKHIYSGDKQERVIMAGDFNTIPLLTLAGTVVPLFYSDQKKKFHAFLRQHGFETSCEKVGHTMQRGLVRFQLDGIYTKNAAVAQFQVERSVKASDHFPLWADIKL